MKHHLNLTEKQALVTRYTGGETVSAICMETGISKSTLYSWIKQYQPARTRSGRVITRRIMILCSGGVRNRKSSLRF